jgi:hypothetical protein
MEHNKAHGFPAKFYHVFWEPIKKDLMVLKKGFNGSFPQHSYWKSANVQPELCHQKQK